jgi:glycosyltransferase involved in cell wall biosynthesis
MILSIIIPIYNSEKYLEDTLYSFLDKSFLNDFEIILVNDGSSDKSDFIVSQFIESNKSIQTTYVKIPNSGVSHARNIGFDLAKGDYLLFLDSDDLLTQDAFKIIFDKIKNFQDINLFNFNTINETGEIINVYPKSILFNEINLSGLVITDKVFLENTLLVWTSSIIYNRKYLINIENKHDILLTNGEDSLFQFISIINANKIMLNKEIISLYRIRNDSVSHTINLKRLDILASYYKIILLVQKSYNLVHKKKLILKYKIDMIDFIQGYINQNKKIYKLKTLETIFGYIKNKHSSLFDFLLNDSNFYDFNIKYKIKRYIFLKFCFFLVKIFQRKI